MLDILYSSRSLKTKFGQTRGRIAVVNLLLPVNDNSLGDFLGGEGGAIRGAHVNEHIGAGFRAGARTQGV